MPERITVALVADLQANLKERIAATDPRLTVVDAAREAATYFQAQKKGPEALQEASAALRARLVEAEIIYGIRFDREFFTWMPHLRWVQAMSAGVDHLLNTGLAERGVRLTCSRIHGIQISEYVITMMLALTKRIPEFVQAQAERRRLRVELDEVYEKTVGIVGMGAIGGRIAEIARVLGLRVVACRRRPPDSSDRRADQWYQTDRLRDMLAECDYVVLAVPGTAETQRLIGAAELAAMKPSAYLINIARGSVVDEPALIEALRERRIAGAALDVFVREPLPDDSPLWDLPNVILTPHLSGLTARYNERAVDLFTANLTRYLAGQALLNEVDFARGY